MLKTHNKYITPKKIKETFEISTNTLRRWEIEGKLSCVKTAGNHRLYALSEIQDIFQGDNSDPQKTKICYARVSSSHQKDDLQRQVEFLRKKYPDHEVVQDIGSGLNWNRKGFRALLDRVGEGAVSEVVVAYRDRLARFGVELVEWIFEKAGTKLVVLSREDVSEVSKEKELADDLLAVITFFTARNNGLRAKRNRNKRKEYESVQDPDLPDSETEEDPT